MCAAVSSAGSHLRSLIKARPALLHPVGTQWQPIVLDFLFFFLNGNNLCFIQNGAERGSVSLTRQPAVFSESDERLVFMRVCLGVPAASG